MEVTSSKYIDYIYGNFKRYKYIYLMEVLVSILLIHFMNEGNPLNSLVFVILFGISHVTYNYYSYQFNRYLHDYKGTKILVFLFNFKIVTSIFALIMFNIYMLGYGVEVLTLTFLCINSLYSIYMLNILNVNEDVHKTYKGELTIDEVHSMYHFSSNSTFNKYKVYKSLDKNRKYLHDKILYVNTTNNLGIEFKYDKRKHILLISTNEFDISVSPFEVIHLTKCSNPSKRYNIFTVEGRKWNNNNPYITKQFLEMVLKDMKKLRYMDDSKFNYFMKLINDY